MIDARWWLACLVVWPVMVAGLSMLPIGVERLRQAAVAGAIATLLVSLGVFVVPGLGAFEISAPSLSRALGGALFRVDALSSALLPFAASLWLLTVAVSPRAALDRRGLRRTALATLVTLGCFLTESPIVLLVLWISSVGTFWAALSEPAHQHQRRIVAVYLGASSVLFGGGAVLLAWPAAQGTTLEVVGVWLVVIAALVRKGIFPFHAWVPEVFDRGRLGPAILFSAPQLGAYVTAVLIVPRASPELLRLIAVLALGTAVYGAALALVQTSARRACGYLFMSQSALVMAGLDCTSNRALAGGLLLWLSAGIAFAGLARCVLVLEARRGRLDLSVYHGGYERTPVLAASFLVMGLACTGFPGTLGFVGQELLVDGAVDVFPVLGFAVVVAAALTGLAVLRMYFALFCGRPSADGQGDVRIGLIHREAWTFASVVLVLVGTGIVPAPIVDSRFLASDEILLRRRTSATREAPGAPGAGIPAPQASVAWRSISASR